MANNVTLSVTCPFDNKTMTVGIPVMVGTPAKEGAVGKHLHFTESQMVSCSNGHSFQVDVNVTLARKN